MKNTLASVALAITGSMVLVMGISGTAAAAQSMQPGPVLAASPQSAPVGSICNVLIRKDRKPSKCYSTDEILHTEAGINGPIRFKALSVWEFENFAGQQRDFWIDLETSCGSLDSVEVSANDLNQWFFPNGTSLSLSA